MNTEDESAATYLQKVSVQVAGALDTSEEILDSLQSQYPGLLDTIETLRNLPLDPETASVKVLAGLWVDSIAKLNHLVRVRVKNGFYKWVKDYQSLAKENKTVVTRSLLEKVRNTDTNDDSFDRFLDLLLWSTMVYVPYMLDKGLIGSDDLNWFCDQIGDALDEIEAEVPTRELIASITRNCDTSFLSVKTDVDKETDKLVLKTAEEVTRDTQQPTFHEHESGTIRVVLYLTVVLLGIGSIPLLENPKYAIVGGIMMALAGAAYLVLVASGLRSEYLGVSGIPRLMQFAIMIPALIFAFALIFGIAATFDRIRGPGELQWYEKIVGQIGFEIILASSIVVFIYLVGFVISRLRQ